MQMVFLFFRRTCRLRVATHRRGRHPAGRHQLHGPPPLPGRLRRRAARLLTPHRRRLRAQSLLQTPQEAHARDVTGREGTEHEDRAQPQQQRGEVRDTSAPAQREQC